MIYVDTSALIKKYVVERGTPEVTELLKGDHRILTSRLTYPEMLSALSRKRREGDLDRKRHSSVLERFTTDWQTLVLVELSDALFPLIRSLTEKYPLRGADAVHLASARWISQELRKTLLFAAADLRLLDAASGEGLDTINPGTA